MRLGRQTKALPLAQLLFFWGWPCSPWPRAQPLPSLDELQLRRAALAFTAGAFFGALFVLFELLTKGLITRAVMNAIPLLQPDSAKHVRFSNGEVTKIKYSVFNRNVAIVMFNLWPGLLVLRTIEDGTRRAVLTGLFLLAVAVPVIISDA